MSRSGSGIFRLLLSALFCLSLSRCATAPSLPPLAPPLYEEKAEIEPEPDPRTIAALELMEHARKLIRENKPEEAIRTLERAVHFHPANGGNYYYLAEAWLLKGNVRQAGEFHRLAEMYLRNNPEWKSRLRAQQEAISRRSPPQGFLNKPWPYYYSTLT